MRCTVFPVSLRDEFYLFAYAKGVFVSGLRISFFVVIVLVAGAAYYYLTLPQEQVFPDGVVAGNGRVEAVQADVSTKIPGRVSEIILKEGDLVEIGDVVARMDVAQLEAQLMRARAEVLSAKSQVEIAQAQVAVARYQLELSESTLRRAEKLLSRDNVSRESYDITATERDVARAGVASAEANFKAAMRNVNAAQAVADEIDTQIADAELKSAVFGRVLYRLAEPGEVLGTGGKILTIVNYEDIYMEIFLPAHQAHLVNVGSEARVKLDIWDFGIPARVSYVSPESQFTPKQVETESERDKLMFRIKIRPDQELILHNIERVKAGLRGVAYVHLDGFPDPDWSTFLPDMPPEALPQDSAGTNDS
ncbi:MAG: HlyD family efflux transporter periplasmic adaptor subunit [Rhodobacter sp.]|nr:HlyD family efflux transporter periplasmic adaptor subunit [Rhodobacter sp.]